jgi:hypothetical protein
MPSMTLSPSKFLTYGYYAVSIVEEEAVTYTEYIAQSLRLKTLNRKVHLYHSE